MTKQLLLAGDLVVTGVATMTAHVLSAHQGFGVAVLLSSLVVMILVVSSVYLVEGYSTEAVREARGNLLRVPLAVLLVLLALGAFRLVLPDFMGDPEDVVKFGGIILTLLLLWRILGVIYLDKALSAVRVAVIADRATAVEAQALVSSNETYSIEWSLAVSATNICSLLDREPRKVPDIVVFDQSGVLENTTLEALLQLRCSGVEVLDLATFVEVVERRVPVDRLSLNWVALHSDLIVRHGGLEDRLKRLLDVVLSALVLVIGMPVLLGVALGIFSTSGAPVIFRQRRVGQFGRLFTIYKFRSMRLDAEADGKARWAQESDPRITRLGAFLRRTHLDELPQLWNVLRGDMTLVGPRPERPEFVEQLRPAIPFYELRHMVRPGVTGWAQVRYPYGASIEDSRRKLEYDLYYVRHHSLLWDLRILARTAAVSLLRRGSR